MNIGEAVMLPSNVALVAVHGTGTPLGDPIEVGALGSALSSSRTSASQLVLASNKVRALQSIQRTPKNKVFGTSMHFS